LHVVVVIPSGDENEDEGVMRSHRSALRSAVAKNALNEGSLLPFYHDAATTCLRPETNVRHVGRLARLAPVPKLDFARVALLDKSLYVV
jgi:hypothetical protein